VADVGPRIQDQFHVEGTEEWAPNFTEMTQASIKRSREGRFTPAQLHNSQASFDSSMSSCGSILGNSAGVNRPSPLHLSELEFYRLA